MTKNYIVIICSIVCLMLSIHARNAQPKITQSNKIPLAVRDDIVVDFQDKGDRFCPLLTLKEITESNAQDYHFPEQRRIPVHKAKPNLPPIQKKERSLIHYAYKPEGFMRGRGGINFCSNCR